MLIKDIFATKKPVISFEIFPPKKDSPIETIYNTIEGLKDLKPDFISVTYGAGGSTTNRTVEIASLIKHKYGLEALAHLTCIAATKQEIEGILNSLKDNGIENILALRGDLPQNPDFKFPDPLHYQYAKDLILHIQSLGSFSVGAACYPEGHLECDDIEKDLSYLKQKVDTGVDFLITQLFFDNEIFYEFLDHMARARINVPVTAGIMPVLNRKQIERITSLCKASLTKKFIRIMERYEHNPEALKEAGIAYATEQIIDLLSWGVDGIHIYTMNRPEVTRKIVENMSTIRSVIST
ncbi:MAG: methylenetetrahydrofolate reductase [NAD(P)H] [Bacillota bacterium]